MPLVRSTGMLKSESRLSGHWQSSARSRSALAWPLVCGSVVADRTRVLEFADGVLRVEVSDAGWKREMQGLAPRYVAQLNRYSGQKVERIEFVIRQV